MRTTVVMAALMGLMLATPALADEAWNRMRAEHDYAGALSDSFDDACRHGVPAGVAWAKARNGFDPERANLVRYHAKSARQIEAEVSKQLAPCVARRSFD